MEQKKLVSLQRVLKDHGITDFRGTVLDIVKKLVPVVRCCYETFLQDDNVSLAWVFTIDGVFLLNLFQTIIDDKHPKLDPKKRLLAQEIMMVENQIPFLVLKEIIEALNSSSGSSNFPPSSSTAIHSPPLQEQMMVDNQIPCKVTTEIEEPLCSDLLPSERLHILPSVYRYFTAIHSPPLQEQMLVDNQIPTSVFRSSTAIQPLPILSSLESKNFSPSIFRSFSEIHSPLELCSPLQAPNHVEHLLHYMYRSIINNNPITNIPLRRVSRKTPSVMEKIYYVICIHSLVVMRRLYCIICMKPIPSADYFSDVTEITNFLNKVPKKEIVQLYEQTITALHNFSTNKITIPSASKLHRRAGIRFQDLPKERGVQNIYVDSNNIYLPRVTLNNDLEVILRNLVAYEKLMPHSTDHLPLTEYMGLMCGLIVNVDDVKLLKKENIIKGELGEGEVVKMFVGMSGSILSLKTQHKSELQEVIDEVNRAYESKLRIRAYLLMKKLASWVLVGLTHIGSFVGATWKIVAFMISIVTVFMLTYQAYCDVYGCDKNNVTMLPYASS